MGEDIIQLTNFIVLFLSILLNIAVLIFSKKKDKNIKIDHVAAASIFHRLVAYWIDVIIVLAAVVLSWKLLCSFGIAFEISHFTIPALILLWVYFASFESSVVKATPGKYLFGIQVLDLNGLRISFVRSSARYILTFLSDFTFSLGNVLVFLTKYNQSLHDILSSTIVVDKKGAL